jgi:putative ABC transport system permease protein
VLARAAAGRAPAVRRALLVRLEAVAAFAGQVDVALLVPATIASRLMPFWVVLPTFVLAAVSLAGSLWLEVQRRTGELGLRRAVGATARAVRGQVLLEVAVLATRAAVVAMVVVAHVVFFAKGLDEPAAPALSEMILAVARYLALLPFTLASFVALVLAGAWLPSRLALRISPMEALRDE